MARSRFPQGNPNAPAIFLVAGEASGDLLGAGLMRELKKSYPNARFRGIGGPRMIAEGLRSQVPMERLSVMGIGEVLGRLPELLRIRKELNRVIADQRPDLVVGIDSPDFTLGVEAAAKEQGIKTAHYVSPSVWAWRQKRIKKIRQAVGLMLTLLPFEADFYRRHQVPVRFVGHPLADLLARPYDTHDVRRRLGLAADGSPWLAVLPGSRGGEMKFLGPLFIETMKRLSRDNPNLRFVAPMANDARRQQMETLLKRHDFTDVTLVDGQSREVMAASNAVLLASGTATLEAMLLKKPMVVAYRWSWLNHAIIAPQVKIPYVSLPNLLAGDDLVEEFIQSKATTENLVPAVQRLFQSDQRQRWIESFESLHRQLQQNADGQAAAAIREYLDE